RLGYADAVVRHCKKCNRITLKEECPVCKEKTDIKRKISFVDAPGHETLMATVIAAASILDGALFLIAANEPCPQPQTVEHMIVLNALGIKNIIIVQTKIDLVSKEKALENYRQIKEFLKGTIAENAPVIPVAANVGLNIDELVAEIEKNIPTPKRDENAPLRAYISRSFDVNLPGTEITKLKGGVVGGSIVSGVLKEGEKIDISPGIQRKENLPFEKITTTARSIREENEKLEIAKPGGLIAVATDIDPAFTKSDGLVGNIITKAGEAIPAKNEIEVSYTLLNRPDMEVQPLKENEPVVVNVHTYTGIGIIKNLKKGIALIQLKRPVVIYPDMYIALSRKVGQRWRLCALGKMK
ncbi:MAG: translation initiation factor IF-2 subunit gamma, partial [Candidatus Bilamarchaeaceae archaeon]